MQTFIFEAVFFSTAPCDFAATASFFVVDLKEVWRTGLLTLIRMGDVSACLTGGSGPVRDAHTDRNVIALSCTERATLLS
jgi:hypothetical protein